MKYSNETNLIVQSACTAMLLMELSHNSKDFIKSDFFKNMSPNFPGVKQFLQNGDICIGNQGTVLMILYALLVLPKELISNKYKNEYQKINQEINLMKISYINTYLKDGDNFLKHMRNALSHGKIEFDDSNQKNILVTFNDDYKGQSFSVTFNTVNVAEISIKLLEINSQYIKDLY